MAGIRVQRLIMPSGAESMTVVADGLVVDPVDRFLAHLAAIDRSPNTVRAYGHDLRDYFEFLACRGLSWDRVALEDLGRFVVWLRLPVGARREVERTDTTTGQHIRPPATAHSTPTTPQRLPQPAAHRDCTHCGGPVTIVALLTTPEAARPTMPIAASDCVIPLHRGQG